MRIQINRAQPTRCIWCFFAAIVRVVLRPAIPFSALIFCGFWITTGEAQTNFQRIISFGPNATAGSSPRGQLLEGSDGMLSGTTYQGGSNNLGTVFRAARDGTAFCVLRHFEDCVFPFSGLVEGPSGHLYGTASGGGLHNAGAVFRLAKDGTGFISLHDFDPAAGQGAAPIATLLKAADGKLYGTTAGGGSYNHGSIFRLNTDGRGFETIFSFGNTNGSTPVAGLIQGQDGWLYGVTRNGGTGALGTLFRAALDGRDYTVLHHFSGGVGDGSLPFGNLLQASDGFLYGTTYSGGSARDAGTVFRLNTDGTEYTIVYVFGQNNSTEPSVPAAGLVEGQGGWFYGTTTHGGINDGGIAFALNSDGTGFTVLHQFTGSAGDGSQPFGALLKASDGALYGSTYFGGDYSANGVSGILFRLFAAPAQVRITSIALSPAGSFLTFSGGAAGHTYEIQVATDPGASSWQAIGSADAGIDGTFQFTDPAATNSPVRFYRSAGQ